VGVGASVGFRVLVGLGVGLGLGLGRSEAVGTTVATTDGATVGAALGVGLAPGVAGGPALSGGMKPMHVATGRVSMAEEKRSADAGAHPRSAPGAPTYTSSQVPSAERAVTSSESPAVTRPIGVPLS
jgi:hypothetical protein